MSHQSVEVLSEILVGRPCELYALLKAIGRKEMINIAEVLGEIICLWERWRRCTVLSVKRVVAGMLYWIVRQRLIA